MMLDLTDDKAHALVQLLRRTIDFDPYPIAPRLAALRAIPDKIEPPAPQPEIKAAIEGPHDAPPSRGQTSASAMRVIARIILLIGALGWLGGCASDQSISQAQAKQKQAAQPS